MLGVLSVNCLLHEPNKCVWFQAPIAEASAGNTLDFVTPDIPLTLIMDNARYQRCIKMTEQAEALGIDRCNSGKPRTGVGSEREL